MGAYYPSRLINDELEKKIIEKIIKQTLKGLSDDNIKYKGFLYAGLMIVDNEPFLIEYNVRMGDPECQIILPILKTDLTEVIEAVINEKLEDFTLEWHNSKSLCVVLCSNVYPDKYEKNIEIQNFNSVVLDEKNFLFHAGTIKNNEKILAIGGRVLNFVSISNDFYDARKKIHQNLEKLNWKAGFYRKDIAYKVINK